MADVGNAVGLADNIPPEQSPSFQLETDPTGSADRAALLPFDPGPRQSEYNDERARQSGDRKEHRPTAGHGLQALETAVQGVDQILGVFHADREPHQAVGDAGGDPLLAGDRTVGHRHRMGDQRLDRSQVFGEAP